MAPRWVEPRRFQVALPTQAGPWYPALPAACYHRAMPDTAAASTMQLASNAAGRRASDVEMWSELLDLDGRAVLDLGCGAAPHARAIATRWPRCQVVACEVDAVQHARNLAAEQLPNLRFRACGAEAIDTADGSFDVVLMMKSLHHVPMAAMADALAEVRRVLKPGGLAYVVEPVFAGPFNEVLRLFHDEQAVRAAAFTALAATVADGSFELDREVFYRVPLAFRDFDDFAVRVIHVTHTEHRLDAALLARVRARFEQHLDADGVHFEAPMRLDLLRRPAP